MRAATIPLATSLAFASGFGGIGTTSAHAQTSDPSFCVVAEVLNDCLYNWDAGGRGTMLRIDGESLPDENFTLQRLTGRCNDGYVTETCPFNSAAFDKQYYNNGNNQIVEIRYENTELCVSSYTSQDAQLGNCNTNANGTGGDTGSVFIWNGSYYMISLYWTNENNSPRCMEDFGFPGSANSGVNLDYPTSAGCEGWEESPVG
jgi:hypothetical protein